MAGEACHKLGGVGACSPRKILDFHVPLDQFWCILSTYDYSLVFDIFEGEVNHIAKVVGMSYSINWVALQIDLYWQNVILLTQQ